jgi:uncharacterized protein (TIGR03067 family)
MPCRIPLAAIVALFLVVSARADEKTDAELKSLVGNWKVEKAELAGKDATAFLKDVKLSVGAGGKYTVEIGKEKEEGTFTVDLAKTPKQMDITPKDGPNKGKTIKVIYKLDGDTLVACYDLDTEKGTRPEKFESKPDTMRLLTTYKREKK